LIRVESPLLVWIRVSAEDTRKPKEAVSPNKEEKPVEIPYITTPYRV